MNKGKEFEELKKDQPWICWRGQEKVAKYVWDHQQSKLDAKDELLREAIDLLLEECPEVPDSYDLAFCDRCQFLNKPEIKKLKNQT